MTGALAVALVGCGTTSTTVATSPGTLPESWFANAYQKTAHPSKPAYSRGDTGLIKIANDGTRVIWATWIGPRPTSRGSAID